MSTDVAIIGAGAAGLAAAHRLMERRPELSVLVLEAAGRIGGRAWTISPPDIDGAFLDLGCGWLHGARTNAWTEIASRLGHPVDRTPAPWDSGSRRWDVSEPERREAQAAVAAFFERAAARDPGLPDGSLGDVLEPGNRWNPLIQAIGAFLNGADPSLTSIADTNRYSPGPGPDWRLRHGYGTLIAAFGAAIPVRLQTPVMLVRHGGRNRVDLETAQGAVSARAVIVTVSTNVLAEEKLRFDPPLPDKVEAASNLPLGLANKAFLRLTATSDLAADTNALGSALRRDTAGYQIRPFGTNVVEAYFAGSLALDMEKQGGQGALAFAADELAGHFGSGIQAQLSYAAMSHWARHPYVGGSYSYAKPGAADCRTVLAEPVDSRIFFAGEACSPARFTTAHGAYESGVAAADAVSRLL